MSLEAENAQLRRENRELRAANEALWRRVAELEETLAALQKKERKPASFVKGNKPKTEAKEKRKKRAGVHNRGRRREEATRIERHRLGQCP